LLSLFAEIGVELAADETSFSVHERVKRFGKWISKSPSAQPSTMKALSHLGDSLTFRRFARRSACSDAQRSQPLRRK
jgi:hypothetical protein